MGNPVAVTSSFNLPDGREVIIETGKLATQADGSVVVRLGNTMLFCSVVSSREMRADQSFFPLSVDYQEKFASAGRIPGNFFRREARISDYEILICRLVDRAIRPLFPDGYLYDTQVIINLISADKDTPPDALAALAASAAFAVSDIPFQGPISEVRVARIDGAYQVNPSYSDLERADLNIIVAATHSDVTMVEGEANECAEADLVEAIKIGHEAIKVQIAAQLVLAEKVGATTKREMAPPAEDNEVKELVAQICSDAILKVAQGKLDKNERKAGFKAVSALLEEKVKAEKGDEYYAEKKPFWGKYLDKLKKKVIRQMVLDSGIRLDGRDLRQVRPIWTEIDYLPSTHGSAIFNRGETQALTSVTLGTKTDEMMLDTALELSFEKFILHYNFPGFSVGEVKPMRGPGRREVGHANLAARSIRKVLLETPYTIRIVSDILESNGSSSMATVCAGSLALMDAGVPLTARVAGIAMGMIADENGRVAILSDILGDEDALGDMDFKLTGTEKGITGCQMDIKVDGLPYDKLTQALEQAREGRIHILNEMAKSISTHREDYKPHAPRIMEIRVDRSFIGGIIGPGGSIIQNMQRQTGAVINIEEVGEEGIVTIASPNKESIDAAMAMIKQIIFVPTEGEIYEGVVREIVEFGAFIDFKGKSGLLHVSEISYQRVGNVEDVLKVGQTVNVKLLELDKKTGKMRLSMKALEPRPEGMEDRGDDRGGFRRPPGGRPPQGRDRDRGPRRY